MSIVREHGGSIDVEALPARGSAFTVYFPVAPAEPKAAVSAEGGLASTEARRTDPGLFKDRSLLVLDDEESIRMLLEEGLSAQGLHVDSAATAGEAVDLVKRRSYDAVLCDLNLSAGGFAAGGREAAEQILSAAGAAKPAIVFMTGDIVDPSDSKPGEPRRLQKPFRISEVVGVLREIFSAVSVDRVQN
jgi:CheY-like chemotaxis protein